MRIVETPIPGLLVIEPRIMQDERGFFIETYHEIRYAQAGITARFVQDNQSRSLRGVLRGLHYQLRRPQAKLVRVARGEVFDVAVDIRRGSPTFGQWYSTLLCEANARQIFIPEGFAHGFCVLSEVADLAYKCSEFFDPEDQFGVIWNDPDLGIAWPVASPILSEQDRGLPRLSEASLPEYGSGG